MSDSILQSFLDNRFIKTNNQEHIANLDKAVAEIQKLLSKKKTKVIGHTLVALDPTVSDGDPVVAETEAIIIRHWPAFRNSVAKTKDIPLAYVQAVILEALSRLGKDEVFAAIIWHTGCGIINHYKLSGQKKTLIDFLLEIGKKVEEVGRKDWSIIENAKIDAYSLPEISSPNVNKAHVSKEEFQKHLMAAAVHSGWAPHVGGVAENPASQAQNNHLWPKFFAERAAEGLTEIINAALAGQDKSMRAISTSLQQSIGVCLASLKPYLEQVSSSILRSSQSLVKRNNLIWWRQALYSQRLDLSYRKLCPSTTAVAMAVDLADNTCPIHPHSVVFFLKETLRDVLGDETDTDIPAAEILAAFQTFAVAEKQLLEDLLNEYEGRKSLGACMADIAKGSMNAEEFFKRTGLDKNTKVSLGELTVWLFHDLQASKLANEKK